MDEYLITGYGISGCLLSRWDTEQRNWVDIERFEDEEMARLHILLLGGKEYIPDWSK